MGPDNPPLYVSNVTYGRQLMFFASTDVERNEAAVSLQAGFNALVTSGRLNVTFEQKAVFERTEIACVAIGAPDVTPLFLPPGAAIQNSELEDLVRTGRTFTRERPGSPIRFQLSYVRFDQAAAVNFTGKYRRESFEPMTFNQLQIDFETDDDDKDRSDSVQVEIFHRNTRIFIGEFGKGERWGDHTVQSRAIPLPSPILLDSSEIRNMRIRGTLMSPDDNGWNAGYEIFAIDKVGRSTSVARHGPREIGDGDSTVFDDPFTS
jgi:hypothetical protein